MKRHFGIKGFSKSMLSGLVGLGALLVAPLAAADHLPPGIDIIFLNSPAYIEKLAANTGYSDQDIADATELAKLGDAEAQLNLGAMLVSRGKYPEAATWFRAAADEGIAPAAYDLGTLYFNGQGFPQDFVRARHWFEEAAKRNDKYAEFQLGYMYDFGKGVTQDPAQAVNWYTRAAQEGLAPAQYNLAVLYHNAEGVQKDNIKAYAWMLVAEQGGVDVSSAKQAIGNEMSADEIHQAEALSRTLYVPADVLAKK